MMTFRTCITGSVLLSATLIACYPKCTKEEPTEISFSLSPPLVTTSQTAIFDGTVTVTEITDRGTQWDVDVAGTNSYDGEEHELRLTIVTTPEIDLPLVAGEELRFQYLQDEPIPDWINTFAGFWRGDDLVLGLIDQAIEVQGSIRVDPLLLDVKRGYCKQRSDNCGAHERIGIRFTHPDGESTLVMDHGTGVLLGSPTYRLIVEEAYINYDSLFVPCSIRSRGWLRAVILDTSS